MKKMYETHRDTKNKNKLKIKVDQTKVPNKLHFDVQRSTRAVVYDDRRKKDPKHKAKVYDEE